MRTDATEAEVPGDGPQGTGTGPPPLGSAPPSEASSIARGLASLIASQLVTTPLSMVVSAVLARRLGPSDFGAFYLANAAAGLGFLFVEWGQSQAMAASVARDRSSGEGLVGTSLALKLALGAVATAVLLVLGSLLDYSPPARMALAFVCLQSMFVALQASGTAVLRGYERTDLVAALSTAGNLVASSLIIALALAGFGLRGVLWSAVASAALLLVPTGLLLKRNGFSRPRFESARLRELLGAGSAFLFFNLVLALQPYIDVNFLSRLTPTEALGWHAAARRITGVLIVPATSLGFTLYPTLSRLHHEAPDRLLELVRTGLRIMVLLGIPAALGTVLFAGTAIHLVYGANYEGAVPNLQVLAPWVMLVYFSILVGFVLLATGRVLVWSLVQLLTVAVSAVADPPLIRYFQARLANGAVGVGVSSVISELFMVAIGAALLPRAMLRDGLVKTLARSAAAGAAMFAVGWALAPFPAPLGILGSIAAYGIALWAVGGLQADSLRAAVALLRDKAARRASGT